MFNSTCSQLRLKEELIICFSPVVMVQPGTLKKRHSLKGLFLLPVIRKVKDKDMKNLKEFARRTWAQG